MGYKIRVTPLGAKDLEEIVTYMTQELDNADAAASFLDEVDACYARMEEMPFLFEECHDPRLKAFEKGHLPAVFRTQLLHLCVGLRDVLCVFGGILLGASLA